MWRIELLGNIFILALICLAWFIQLWVIWLTELVSQVLFLGVLENWWGMADVLSARRYKLFWISIENKFTTNPFGEHLADIVFHSILTIICLFTINLAVRLWILGLTLVCLGSWVLLDTAYYNCKQTKESNYHWYHNDVPNLLPLRLIHLYLKNVFTKNWFFLCLLDTGTHFVSAITKARETLSIFITVVSK